MAVNFTLSMNLLAAATKAIAGGASTAIQPVRLTQQFNGTSLYMVHKRYLVPEEGNKVIELGLTLNPDPFGALVKFTSIHAMFFHSHATPNLAPVSIGSDGAFLSTLPAANSVVLRGGHSAMLFMPTPIDVLGDGTLTLENASPGEDVEIEAVFFGNGEE